MSSWRKSWKIVYDVEGKNQVIEIGGETMTVNEMRNVTRIHERSAQGKRDIEKIILEEKGRGIVTDTRVGSTEKEAGHRKVS